MTSSIKTFADIAALEWMVTAMTKREQILEARRKISGGMERVADRTIWQNELIWWLCKAVLLLLDREIKKK